MTQSAVNRFQSFDGVEIAWRTLGEGPPALLLHGFLASAELNVGRVGGQVGQRRGRGVASQDQDNGSAQELAALLPDARALSVPGDPLSAVVEPQLARTFADHLAPREGPIA